MTATPAGATRDQRSPRFHRPSWIDGYLAAALVCPFLILLADRNVFFTAAGYVDPWVYRGFFTHFREFTASWFPNTYYGSRMAWVMPGHIAYSLFSPLLANYVLHFAVYYLGALSLYYIVHRFYGAPSAALGVIAYTAYPALWDAVGWDYVDGIGLSYYLCLAALAVRVRRRPHWALAVLAGVAFAALLYTNIVWAVLSPLPFGIYALTPSSSVKGGISLKTAGALLVSFCAGAAALTLAFCVINYRAGGAFLFYIPSVAYLLSHAGGGDEYKAKGYSWIQHAPWLIYPGIALLASSAAWARRAAAKAGRWTDPAAVFHYQLIFAVLILAACEAKGLYFLEYSWYGSFLIPSVFLALIWSLFQFKSESPWRWVLAGAAILLAPWSPLGPLMWTLVSGVSLSVVLVTVSAGVVAGALWQKRTAAVLVGCAALAVLNVYFLGNAGKYQYRASAGDGRKEAFERITAAGQFIDQERAGRRAVFWFDGREANSSEFDSINSLYLWGFTRITRQFPELIEGARTRVLVDTMVVIPTTRHDADNVLADGNRTLEAWMLRLTPRGSKEFTGPGANYRVMCFDVHRSIAARPRPAFESVGPNLALEKAASQSSTAGVAIAANAVDGDTDGDYKRGSVTHTLLQDGPWWQVDLGMSAAIHSIVIWNRTDCCSERLANFWVFASDTPFGPADTAETLQKRAGVWSRNQSVVPNPSATFITDGVRGRYVRVQLGGAGYLSLAEVQVY